MSRHPEPTYAPPDPTPGWVRDLRSILAARYASVQAPSCVPDPLIEVAKAEAFAWLGTTASDAAKAFCAQFGIDAADLHAGWAIGAGTDPQPSLVVTVRHANATIFRYELRLIADDDGVRPRVTLRTNDERPMDRPFWPRIHGASMTSTTRDEVAADIASAFAESVSRA